MQVYATTTCWNALLQTADANACAVLLIRELINFQSSTLRHDEEVFSFEPLLLLSFVAINLARIS